MVSQLLAFVNILRRAGIRVSQSEVLDMFQALPLIELTRENLYIVLSSTLVKNIADIFVLEKLFNYFFAPTCVLPEPKKIDVGKALAKPPRLPKKEFARRLAQIKSWLNEELSQLRKESFNRGESFARAGRPARGPGEGFLNIVRCGKEEKMRSFIREALGSLKNKPGNLDIEKIIQQLKVEINWAEEIERLKDGQEVELLQLQENIRQMERLIRQEVEEYFWREQPKKAFEEIIRHVNLVERDFSLLDPDQIVEVKKKLVRLGRRLATRPGYRRANAPRGQVNMRRTARLAMFTGGVPLVLCYQKKQLTRPQIVILCDLSGSVAPFSKFMLVLLYAMQEKFQMVRSFAFVDGLAEVTGLLKNKDIDLVVRDIYRTTGIWKTGFSDYGAVWTQFYRKYLDAVTPKTTLLILGDARNNYKPSGVEQFAGICERARRVIWLNPAPRLRWNQEDSIMGTYAPYCHKVFECRNLKQLEAVIRNIWIK